MKNRTLVFVTLCGIVSEMAAFRTINVLDVERNEEEDNSWGKSKCNLATRPCTSDGDCLTSCEACVSVDGEGQCSWDMMFRGLGHDVPMFLKANNPGTHSPAHKRCTTSSKAKEQQTRCIFDGVGSKTRSQGVSKYGCQFAREVKDCDEKYETKPTFRSVVFGSMRYTDEAKVKQLRYMNDFLDEAKVAELRGKAGAASCEEGGWWFSNAGCQIAQARAATPAERAACIERFNSLSKGSYEVIFEEPQWKTYEEVPDWEMGGTPQYLAASLKAIPHEYDDCVLDNYRAWGERAVERCTTACEIKMT